MNKRLMIAAKIGHTETINVLLNAIVNQKDRIALLKEKNEQGLTAVMLAAGHGHFEAIQALLNAIVDPKDKIALLKKRNEEGFTAVMLAAQEGHVETINVLLNAIVEPNDRIALLKEKNKYGVTAVTLASQHGYCEAINALLSPIVDPNAKIALLNVSTCNSSNCMPSKPVLESDEKHLFVVEFENKKKKLDEIPIKIRDMADNRKWLHANIIANISECVEKLSKTIHGRKNKSRLPGLNLNQSNLKELLELCENLKSYEAEIISESDGFSMKFKEFESVANDAVKSSMLSIEESWTLFMEKYNVFLTSMNRLKNLHVCLEERVKDYRKFRECNSEKKIIRFILIY